MSAGDGHGALGLDGFGRTGGRIPAPTVVTVRGSRCGAGHADITVRDSQVALALDALVSAIDDDRTAGNVDIAGIFVLMIGRDTGGGGTA